MQKNIRIVLLNTSHPGNIGAAARAMKTMNLSQLYLVGPQYFPHADATARAAGADDILAQAHVVENFSQAIADCQLVIGASARSRALPWPVVDARECGEKVVAHASQGPVAIVFGREREGLTNEELQLCNYHVHIPCNVEYSSLNLAAAVQVLCYEINVAMLVNKANDAPQEAFDAPASHAEIQRFYQHLEETLVAIDFLDPNNPRQLMPRLQRLFNRVGLEQQELNILRGILSAIE